MTKSGAVGLGIALCACLGSTAVAWADVSSFRPVIAIEMSGAGVSVSAARSIREELAELWAPSGLTFVWPSSASGLASECAAVKVVFTDTEPGLARTARRKPLGVVYRVGGYLRRVIFVSPAAVLSLVRKSAAAPRDSLLVAALHARMLARVIAHELGHILFESDAHSQHGLMRERFRPIDALRQGPEHFGLPDDVVGRIANRCARANPIS